jgi:hypothetical protein
MAIRPALVHQPLLYLPVPATVGAIEILNYQTARRLAKWCNVIVYSRRGPGQSAAEVRESVCYARVVTRFDDWVDALEERPALKQLFGFRNADRPLFASVASHLQYGVKVALGIRRGHCDWVHIHNFSQIVPVVRALNPRVRIALHMHCEGAV